MIYLVNRLLICLLLLTFSIKSFSQENYVSDKNVTTTALNNSETYTGTYEDVRLYEEIIIALKADQDSTDVVVRFAVLEYDLN